MIAFPDSYTGLLIEADAELGADGAPYVHSVTAYATADGCDGPRRIEVPLEPYELERSRAYAQGYDLVITNDPATLAAHRAAHPRVEYLPPGFDPAVMKPDPSATPAYDLAFVGTWFRERVAFFEAVWPEIESRPHLLAGYWFKDADRVPQPDRPPADSFLHAKVRHAIVWPPELCKVYQRSRIALNLHRGSLWHANPEAVRAQGINPRLFEIAGTGAFQLCDERSELRRCFDPDEVPSFRDAQEAKGLIRDWLAPSREAARRTAAGKALARALAGHTYLRRAESLLAWMR